MEDTLNQRQALIAEYTNARLQFGDWDEDVEEMTDAQRRRHFRSHAETLTNEQLISACNSYAMAD